jgi:hypothetical protein
MNRFEVFNPCNGKPLYRFPFAWMARAFTRFLNGRYHAGLDWERAGEGWTS